MNLPTWPHDDFLHAWWVSADLLAGEYPGDIDHRRATEKRRLLADAGITAIVDLTTPADHLVPYADALPQQMRHLSFPIPDRGVVDDDRYDAILDHIEGEIAAGGRVYLHCWGGVGRTCTVLACLLGRDGADLDTALRTIGDRRAGTRKAHRPFLESPAQRRFLTRRFSAG